MCFFTLSTNSMYATPPVFEEYGKAGYYADKLHGRKTASGKAYDKNAMTCAHKSLPFGTKLKVTRLDNGESVIVTVNDRGPYSAGYVVDVSRKAAVALGIIKAGHAKVKLEIAKDDPESNDEVKPLPEDQFDPNEETPAAVSKPKIKVLKAAVPTASSSPKAEAPVEHSTPSAAKAQKSTAKLLTPKGGEANTSITKTITQETTPQAAPLAAGKRTLYKVDIAETPRKGAAVQVGTLYDADNVLPILRKLRKDWPGNVLVDVEQGEGSDIITYRVMIGPFANKKAAEAAQKTAKRKGYKECFVVELSGE
jgi:rare lipoprotein A